MTRNEYHTRINEFGDKAWQQTPTLPPLPTEKEQQPMKIKLIKGARKRFDEAKRVATVEGQKLCRGYEKAYCRGETWVTVQCRTSDGKIIGHYEIFQEPFFHDTYPKRDEVDKTITQTLEEMPRCLEGNSKLRGIELKELTFYVETQVYSYNTADDFGREFPTPHGEYVCEEIAEVTL